MSDKQINATGGEVAAEQSPAPAPEKPKPRPRPKMTLNEQSVFLCRLLARCVMHSGDSKGGYAGEATLTLTTDDMLRLETIQQTIAVFDVEGAAELVRDAIWRKRQRGSGRR